MFEWTQKISAGMRWRKNDSARVSINAPLIHPKSLGIAICGGLAIAASVFVFTATSQKEHRIEATYQQQAIPFSALFLRQIEGHLETLRYIGQFYAASERVSRTEFENFVAHSLAQNSGLQALEWIPRVTGTERAAFKTVARGEGFEDFRITEQNAAGDFVAAAMRDEYFPVFYACPLEPNLPIIGFDIGSEPVRRAALDAARDSGRITATQRLHLVEETADRFSILAFMPVYANGHLPETGAGRRAQLSGFALGVYRIEDLTKKVLRDLPGFTDLEVFIIDKSAPEESQFLLHYGPKIGIHESGKYDSEGDKFFADGRFQINKPGNASFSTELEIAGRQWQLIFIPAAHVKGYLDQLSWAAAIAVFLLTTSLLYTGVSARHRARQLKYIVSDHTARLEKSNASLRTVEGHLREQNHNWQLLHRISGAVNTATSWDSAIKCCLDEICLHIGWPVGHAFHLIGEEKLEIVSTGVWHLDDPIKYDAFVMATDRAYFNPSQGFIADVMATGQPQWVADIHTHKGFQRAQVSKGLPVYSCFAFPVMIGRKAVAVLEFLSSAPQTPDRDILDLMAQVGTILGRAAERTQAEQSIRKSEEFMRMITDNLPVLITYMDVEQRILFTNKTTETWFAQPRAKLIGHKMPDILNNVKNTDVEELKANFAVVHKGKTRDFELHHTYPDGIKRHVLISYIPHYGPDGRIIGNFSIVQDLTQRKEIEAQLSQSQKLEAIGQLTGGIAHDFNNLLMVIEGYTQRALGQGDDWHQVKISLNEVLKGTDRAASLTKQLLSFSRRQVMEKRAFRPAEAVRDIETLLAHSVGESCNLEFMLDDEKVSVETDMSEFNQALLNLVNNARDAMSIGGTITISTRVVELDQDFATQHKTINPGRHLETAVTDNGAGISAEVLEHIFEPFYTTKEQGKGTGLGMAMVYGFAQQSLGTVTVDSKIGEGTAIKIYLPVVDKTPDKLVAGIEEAQHAKGETILLVEDDTALRNLISGMLEGLGYKVLTACDGIDALEVEAGHEAAIDLLLSDVVMPGMDGFEMADIIRETRPDMKTVFMSGYPTRGQNNIGDIPEYGRFLQKPIKPNNLAKILRSELDDKPAETLSVDDTDAPELVAAP